MLQEEQHEPESSVVCTLCKYPLSAARLAAVPDADTCVSCLTAAGDVPVIRRFDEYAGEGELVSQTYFTRNPYIEQQLKRELNLGSLPFNEIN